MYGNAAWQAEVDRVVEVAYRGFEPPPDPRIRNPRYELARAFFLWIVYVPLWWGRINGELAGLERDLGLEAPVRVWQRWNPAYSVIAVIAGFLLLFVPTYFTVRNTVKRLQAAQRKLDIEPIDGRRFGLLFALTLGIAAVHYGQQQLNEVWPKAPPLPTEPLRGGTI